MKIRPSIAVLMIASATAWASPAMAADAAGRFQIYGDVTCGQWLSWRSDPSIVQNLASMWLGGFISGFNVVVNGPQDVLLRSDLDSALRWIDNYCRQNPLKSTAGAAYSLMQELGVKP